MKISASLLNRVPRKFIWWALRKLGVDKWIVQLVNAQSHVHVGGSYSQEFMVKVVVHQGSVFSPLLFIVVLEALSYEFHAGILCKDLYTDDLVMITDSLRHLVKDLDFKYAHCLVSTHPLMAVCGPVSWWDLTSWMW